MRKMVERSFVSHPLCTLHLSLFPLQEVLLKALGTVCVSCKNALLNPQDPNQPTTDKVRVSFSCMQSGNETCHSSV